MSNLRARCNKTLWLVGNDDILMPIGPGERIFKVISPQIFRGLYMQIESYEIDAIIIKSLRVREREHLLTDCGIKAIDLHGERNMLDITTAGPGDPITVTALIDRLVKLRIGIRGIEESIPS